MSLLSDRAQRRQAEREQKKLMKQWQKQLNQQNDGLKYKAIDSESMGLPKLSGIITQYANPLYGKDASKGEMRAVLNLVCGCWNLGKLSNDDQAELWPLIIAPWLDQFTDPAGEMKDEVERIIKLRVTDHGNDQRFIIHYTLEPMGDDNSDKLHLQVASHPLPPSEYKSYFMKRMTAAMEAS